MGIVQILEAKALGLKAATLDRGPLWFDGFGSPEDTVLFAASFARAYPRGLLYRRRFIPEMVETSDFQKQMAVLGFRRRAGPGYQTIIVDIRPDLDHLRAQLRGNWRGWLKKAEGRPLSVETIGNAAQAADFFKLYAADKLQKNYPGPDAGFLLVLAKSFSQNGDLLILQARLDSLPVAGILILCHGRGATYQAGWTNPQGRDIGAHHRLLWEAIKQLKARGVENFDLGGVNDDAAQAIKTFKEGLGGRAVTLAGLYN